MPTRQVHVVRNTDRVGLLHRCSGSLQQPLTDRDPVVQHCRITGGTSPFGPIGLDRQPDRAQAGDIAACRGMGILELAGIQDGQAALDG
jgi:hypothetical protein